LQLEPDRRRHRIDAYREGRLLLEVSAATDLHPHHVVADQIDPQLLAVQLG